MSLKYFLDVSILERAVVEHNLIAASRLYDAITFDSLANLLNVPASRVPFRRLVLPTDESFYMEFILMLFYYLLVT